MPLCCFGVGVPLRAPSTTPILCDPTLAAAPKDFSLSIPEIDATERCTRARSTRTRGARPSGGGERAGWVSGASISSASTKPKKVICPTEGGSQPLPVSLRRAHASENTCDRNSNSELGSEVENRGLPPRRRVARLVARGATCKGARKSTRKAARGMIGRMARKSTR